jgi:hypothetical protein
MNGYSETKLFAKPTFTYTFEGLQDATNYNIEARTFFKEENTNQTPEPPVRDDPASTTTTLPTLSTRPPPRGLHIPLSSMSLSLSRFLPTKISASSDLCEPAVFIQLLH